jgi:glycosyltransferase involved in cell wall biosynthesis
LAERLIRGADVNVLLQTITEGQGVIAGKLYDYLAARKPILAVVSRAGGDAWLLEQLGLGSVVAFDDVDAIARAFLELWQRWRSGTLESFEAAEVQRFDYQNLSAELAALFDEVLSESRH